MAENKTTDKKDFEKEILIENRIANDGKSIGIAYILWFIFGSFGGHRFYLGRKRSALIMLIITLISIAFGLAYFLGFIGLTITTVWWIVDAFLMPGIIVENNQQMRNKLEAKI